MSQARVYPVKLKYRTYFKNRVKYWARKLGVSNLEFLVMDEPYFINVDTGQAEELDLGTAAAYKRYNDAGVVNVALARVWTFPVTKVQVDKSAFHEVFEAGYLSHLRGMAFGTYNEYDVEKEVHRAVRMAEATIFKAMRGKR